MQILRPEMKHLNDHNWFIHDTLDSASVEIERLTRLLNDFRSFARPQAIDFRPTPLRKVIEDALALETDGFSARDCCRTRFATGAGADA